MNLMIKLACLVVGWNPEVLKNCGEVSFAMLKKYFAAIVVLSIIWGVIGWCFAADYLKIESWYGKAITAMFFITIIVCVERYIILSHGKIVKLTIFRTFLAILMAILGSTVFDQIVFKEDINYQMISIRTEKVNEEIPNRTKLIDEELQGISNTINTTIAANKGLYDELNKAPVIIIPEVTVHRRQTGVDSEGKPVYEYDRTTTERSVSNPKSDEAKQNEKLLEEHYARRTELQNRRLNIAKEIEEEYKEAGGFLQELRAMYSLLASDRIVLIFYVLFFLFLMFLELLVITTKGSDECDYDKLLDFQLEQKKKELEVLSS